MKLSERLGIIIADLEFLEHRTASPQFAPMQREDLEWIRDEARKMENDLIQIHTYTACTAGCGKSVRYSYSVGPGMCPDCAWKEIQYLRSKLKGD
jgi:hypothetical protein